MKVRKIKKAAAVAGGRCDFSVGTSRCEVRRPAFSCPRRAGGSKFRWPKTGKRQRGRRSAPTLPVLSYTGTVTLAGWLQRPNAGGVT